MLHQTRGIVLHTLPYSDTSLIAKIYTERFGLQSYILSGARSKRGKAKGNLLQPLTQVDMVVMHKERNSLQRITEISCRQPYQHLHESPLKTGVALFLAEILYKSIREEESNLPLFEFLSGSLHILDLQEEGMANFHLCFLIQLSKYLGFFPHENEQGAPAYFDLQEGIFKPFEPHHPYYMAKPQAQLLEQLLVSTYDNLSALSFSNIERRDLLAQLILYYELHLDSMKDVKSHKVLEAIFS